MRLYLRLMRNNMNKKQKKYKVINEEKNEKIKPNKSFFHYFLCCFYTYDIDDNENKSKSTSTSNDIINLQQNNSDNIHNKETIKNIIFEQDLIEQNINDFYEETKEEIIEELFWENNNTNQKNNENSSCSLEELII